MKRRKAGVKRRSRSSFVHSIATSSRRVAGIAGSRAKTLLKTQFSTQRELLGFAQLIVPQKRSDSAPKPLASFGNPIFGFQISPISAGTIVFAPKIRNFPKILRIFVPKSATSSRTPAFLLSKTVVPGGFAAFPPTYWHFPQPLTDRPDILERMMAKQDQATDQSRTLNLNPAVEMAAKRHKRPRAARPQPNDRATKERIDRKDSWFSLLCSLCSLAAKRILSEMIDLDVLQCIDRKDFWFSFLRSLRSLAAKKIFSEMIDLDVLQRKRERLVRCRASFAFQLLREGRVQKLLTVTDGFAPLCGQSNCGI